MIVVLRASGVGDLAAAVPALRGLRAAFPGRELVLAAPGWLAPLVGLTGAVDRLVAVDDLAAARQLAQQFAPATGGLADAAPAGHHGTGFVASPPAGAVLAVNLHGRGPQSHHLLSALRPDALWAYGCPGAGHHDGPSWREEEHEVRRWCRLLAWYGVPADPDDLGLARPRPDRVPVDVTVVHPGAKTAAKRWPVDRYAAVARALAERGHRVVVTGSAHERDLAEQVVRAAGLPLTAVLAGRTGLLDLAALVAYARLLVSGDTGVGHLATAYGTPSVLLFGPVSPQRWGPPADRTRHRALWVDHWWPDGGTPPTSVPGDGRVADHPDVETEPHPALVALGVAEVLAAADEVLTGVAVAGRTAGVTGETRTAGVTTGARTGPGDPARVGHDPVTAQ